MEFSRKQTSDCIILICVHGRYLAKFDRYRYILDFKAENHSLRFNNNLTFKVN